MALDCFLKAHNMLSNFVEILEFRGFGRHYTAHFEKMPLQGALEISSEMTSLCLCGNPPMWMIERPGLFADSFPSASCCKSVGVPEDIWNKITTLMSYLTESLTAKTCLTRLESTLFALTELPCTAASKKIRVLSVLLKEAAEGVVCCGQTLREPLARIQTKTLLNLVSNFIREWGERPCATRPRLKICKFCDGVINDEVRRYTGRFCCDEAEQLDRLLKEWISLHVPDSDKAEQPKLIPTGEAYDTSTLEDHYRNHIGSLVETCDRAPAKSRVENGRPARLAVVTDGSPRREIEAQQDGARSDREDARTADVAAAAAERIREKRDDNAYRCKRDEIDADKDRRQDRRLAQRDVDEEARERRAAVGKKKKTVTEKDAMAVENGKARDREDAGPYRRRLAEERYEARLPDSDARKIDRLDGAEESRADAKVPGKPAKGREAEWDGNGRLDRREEEERPTARRDGKRAKADKDEEEEMTLPRKEISSKAIEYQLSNVRFVELGWTVLPVTKTTRKIVQYEVRPAKPHLDWFKKYRGRGTEYYDDGFVPFLRFHSDGSGELFYPSGVLAIRVYRPENRKYDMCTVFTPGGKDSWGVVRESQILAIFDSRGNGVVFDEDGAARLSYNQIGGIFTDSPVGLPLAWTWNANPRESTLEIAYTEKSANHLQTEFFSKSMKSSGIVKTPISPSSSRNKEKKVVEVQKPVVEQRQEEVGNNTFETGFSQDFLEENIFHIRVICMKLNEFLGLRIIDRRNIVLRFSARNKNIRIQLGTVINFNKEVTSCTIEASDWKSDMLKCRFQEKLPTRLQADSSLLDIAKEYRKVKRFAKERSAMIRKYQPFFKRQSVRRSCKIRSDV